MINSHSITFNVVVRLSFSINYPYSSDFVLYRFVLWDKSFESYLLNFEILKPNPFMIFLSLKMKCYYKSILLVPTWDYSNEMLRRVPLVGRLVVVIDVNPSHGFWTTRLMKLFGHEGKCTCRYNTHGWIVYIMLFPVVCGTSRGSSWLRRNEFLKMTK
jgi:hypothetical protein